MRSRHLVEKGDIMEERFQKIVSADSHVNEPDDLYVKALGEKFGDRTPRIIYEHHGQKGKFWYGGRIVLKLHDVEADVEKRYRLDVGYVPEVRERFQCDAGIQ